MIWETELYCDLVLAKEILAKFGVGQKRHGVEYNLGIQILLRDCIGKRDRTRSDPEYGQIRVWAPGLGFPDKRSA